MFSGISFRNSGVFSRGLLFLEKKKKIGKIGYSSFTPRRNSVFMGHFSAWQDQTLRNQSRNGHSFKNIVRGFRYLPISKIFYRGLRFNDYRQITNTRNPSYLGLLD